MWTTGAIQYASIEQCLIKILEKRNQQFFSRMIPFTLSKLKGKELAEKLIVHKVSELMHVWFALKGKVKKNRCCPVNQLKFFCCAIGIMQVIFNLNVDNSLYSVCVN